MEVRDRVESRVRLDIETRRKKQQTLMVQAMERKVRSRARQLYESRGQAEGQELQDWFQAESEVLDNTPIAPLYRRMRSSSPESNRDDVPPNLEPEASGCETAV